MLQPSSSMKCFFQNSLAERLLSNQPSLDDTQGRETCPKLGRCADAALLGSRSGRCWGRCWRSCLRSCRRRRRGRRLRGTVGREVLALLGRARSLRKRNVLVDHVMHGQVTLGDGVGAAGLVLVDQLVHVRSKHVLAVLVDVHFISSLAEDGGAAGRATTDAHARKQLESRDDGHREAPTADGLATKPCPEEAREGGVQERDDTADAGQALDARETGASDSACRPCRRRTTFFALRRLRSGGGTASGASPCTAASDDPIEDDDAAQDTAHCGICSVWRA